MKAKVTFNIETGQVICNTRQMNDFYMMETFTFDVLMAFASQSLK